MIPSEMFFLLFLPLLCEGVDDTTVTIDPELSDESTIHCLFQTEMKMKLQKMKLVYANTETTASYVNGKFQLDNPGRITLEVENGTTPDGGCLTFHIHDLSCRNKTWYMCKAIGATWEVNSANYTVPDTDIVDISIFRESTGMEIHCYFQIESGLQKMSLLYGNSNTTASYEDGIFKSENPGRFTLQYLPRTRRGSFPSGMCIQPTSLSGTLIFNVPNPSCEDMMWYTCVALGSSWKNSSPHKRGDVGKNMCHTTLGTPESTETPVSIVKETTTFALPVKGSGCNLKENTVIGLIVSLIVSTRIFF